MRREASHGMTFRVRQGRLRVFYQRRCSAASEGRTHASRIHRILLEHGLVRPVRCRAAVRERSSVSSEYSGSTSKAPPPGFMLGRFRRTAPGHGDEIHVRTPPIPSPRSRLPGDLDTKLPRTLRAPPSVEGKPRPCPREDLPRRAPSGGASKKLPRSLAHRLADRRRAEGDASRRRTKPEKWWDACGNDRSAIFHVTIKGLVFDEKGAVLSFASGAAPSICRVVASSTEGFAECLERECREEMAVAASSRPTAALRMDRADKVGIWRLVLCFAIERERLDFTDRKSASATSSSRRPIASPPVSPQTRPLADWLRTAVRSFHAGHQEVPWGRPPADRSSCQPRRARWRRGGRAW